MLQEDEESVHRVTVIPITIVQSLSLSKRLLEFEKCLPVIWSHERKIERL